MSVTHVSTFRLTLRHTRGVTDETCSLTWLIFSSVGVGYGLDDREIGVLFPAG
jgi:hypothetical protein